MDEARRIHSILMFVHTKFAMADLAAILPTLTNEQREVVEAVIAEERLKAERLKAENEILMRVKALLDATHRFCRCQSSRRC